MNAKRMFYVLSSMLFASLVACVLLVVLGNSVLQGEARKLFDLKLQSRVLDEQHSTLAQAKRDVEKYTSLNTIAKTIVPQDKDQALTVRELTAFAKQAKVEIGSITFPNSTLGAKAAAGSTTAKAGGAISQVVVVPGISGVYQMPITVQSDTRKPISYSQLQDFLRLLENNRHTAQVSQLTIAPSDANGTRLSFQVIVNVYIKPKS